MKLGKDGWPSDEDVIANRDKRIRELEAELNAVYNTQNNIVEQCEGLRKELAALRQQQTFAWNALDSAMIKDHDRTGSLAESITRLAMERDDLRQQQGEPVAEVVDGILGARLVWLYPDLRVPAGTKLYREAAPRVPDGWKLVPVEPTKKMQEAIAARMTYPQIERGYRAMLAAVPEPKE